jgi:hypothetical protein
MPTRPSKREDVFQAAARIVSCATGQPIPEGVKTEEPPAVDEKTRRSQAASILGKLGGSKGGKIRAANLTPRQRQAIAKKAAQARWREK